jgi:hypothetical protein
LIIDELFFFSHLYNVFEVYIIFIAFLNSVNNTYINNDKSKKNFNLNFLKQYLRKVEEIIPRDNENEKLIVKSKM